MQQTEQQRRGPRWFRHGDQRDETMTNPEPYDPLPRSPMTPGPDPRTPPPRSGMSAGAIAAPFVLTQSHLQQIFGANYRPHSIPTAGVFAFDTNNDGTSTGPYDSVLSYNSQDPNLATRSATWGNYPKSRLTYVIVQLRAVLRLESGATVYNATKGKREKIGRLLRMHANKREDIKEVTCGNIAAAAGMRATATGDTLTFLPAHAGGSS